MKCQSHTTKNRNSSHAIKNQNQGKPHQAHNQVIKLKKSNLSELSLVKRLSDPIRENSA